MSEGPRLKRQDMLQVAAVLFRRWDLSGLRGDHTPECEITGSVRRGLELVGDLEILCPLPAGWRADRKMVGKDDALFRAINACVDNPWKGEEDQLFGAPVAEPDPANVLGSAISGLKPGFLCCSLVLRPWPGLELACQVERYTEQNRGWKLIKCTGPRDFGMWFLGQWKKRFGIPIGDEKHKASVDGHLINAAGEVIPVSTEEEAFRYAGCAFIPPERREAFIKRAIAEDRR